MIYNICIEDIYPKYVQFRVFSLKVSTNEKLAIGIKDSDIYNMCQSQGDSDEHMLSDVKTASSSGMRLRNEFIY